MRLAKRSPQLAQQVARRCLERGSTELGAGAHLGVHFNGFMLGCEPQLLREVARELMEALPSSVHAVAGVDLAGATLALACSQVAQLPGRFVRRSEDDGCMTIEGGTVAGLPLAVLDDFVVTGKTVLAASQTLRSAGATIESVATVVDFEAGGRELLARERIELRSLFTLGELVRI